MLTIRDRHIAHLLVFGAVHVIIGAVRAWTVATISALSSRRGGVDGRPLAIASGCSSMLG
jgi:hypothetical protein